jgi:simple sugar transport system permease protein
MAFIGITYAGWDSNWLYLFLGVILFVAVMVNTFISKRAKAAKR